MIFANNKQYMPENKELRWKIVEQFHDALMAGHLGELETFNQVSEYYW